MKPRSLLSIAFPALVLLPLCLTQHFALAQSTGPVRSMLHFSGRVVLEDGTPPPQQAAIERVCGGVARPETYTDAKGRFSFQLGGNQHLTVDASVRPEQGGSVFDRGTPTTSNDPLLVSEGDIWSCDIRATLTGYVSDVIPLAGRKLQDKPDIGTIVLHRPSNPEGTTISAVSAQAPKDAKKAYDDAQGKMRDKKFAEARKDLEKAVRIFPQYATAWSDLGLVCLQLGDLPGARSAYAKATVADPKYVPPLFQLAEIAVRQREWQEAVDLTQRAAKLDPVGLPGIHYLGAVAYFNLKNYEASEKSAREAIRIDPQHRYPKAHHLLGALLSLKGDYAAAVEQLKTYLQLSPGASDTEGVKQQLAEVEKRVTAGGVNRQ